MITITNNIYLLLILFGTWILVDASFSNLDCSIFKSDKDVIRSLPFRVAINPARSIVPEYTYAIVNSQGRVIELTLTSLRNVSLSIFCFKNLQSLTLQYSTNLIIPPEIIHLTSLTTLNLMRISQFLTLPTELFNLTNLRQLSIISSGLQTLPETIQQLFLLSNLTLTDNQLKSLPTSLGRMGSLRWLTVDSNALLSSLDALNGYRRLLEVNASNCAIDHLPSNITALTAINMSNNKLTSLDGLDSIVWMTSTSFIFNNNSITTIPATMTRLQNLHNLDLSNNLLTELPGWVYNVNLNKINLNNNKFDDKEKEWIGGMFRPTNTTAYI